MTQIARPTSFGFVSGIITDQLAGRSDLDKYSVSLEKCENFTISHLGGAYKRSGFRHVLAAYDADNLESERRLVGFDFNSTEGQSYVIEMTHDAGVTALRFFMRGAVVLDPATQQPYGFTTTVIPSAKALREMNFVQSVDRIYFVHDSFAPFTLNRMGHADWTITTLSFTAHPDFPLPWSAGDYPRRIMFFEDRLVLANSPTAPTTVWMSQTSHYTNFNVNTAQSGSVPLATDSIWVRMGGGKLNPIAWLSDRRSLLVGTNDAEFSFSGASATDALTPENAGYRREGSYGSFEVNPLALEDAVIFIARTRKRVYSITLDEYINTFKVEQLNLFCPDIVSSGVKDLTQTEEPYNIIWFVLEDGTLSACTFMREQKVISWHTHTLGGGGIVKAITSIPTPTGSALWATVCYPEATQDKYRIEVLSDSDVPVFMDGYLPGVATVEGQISGLGIFAGQEVEVVVDDGIVGVYQVPADGVLRDVPVSVGDSVVVGYLYEARIQPLPITFTSQSTTTAGMQKNTSNFTFKFWQSVGGRLRMLFPNQRNKQAAGSWVYVPPYAHGAETGVPPRPNTYDWLASPASMFAKEMAWEFVHDTPYPCNILSVSYDLIVGGV